MTSHGSPVSRRPSLVVLDVNETLSDPSPLPRAFESVGLSAHEAETWFAGVLRDGFALTSVGVNPAFAELASEGLRGRLEAAGAAAGDVEAAVSSVMGTFGSLSVHPDVADGIRALQRAGVRMVTLSNGSTAVAAGLLDRAGLADAVDRLLSVEDAEAWKPRPSAYAHALDVCGVAADEAMLVAVHPWDIDGAARAGLRTAWLNRRGGRYPAYFTAPEVEATDLRELARVLV